MTYPTATKNDLLDALTIDKASLHSAFPGTTGANEISGGAPAYAQKAITMNAASGGSRALNSAVTFDVPASTVAWVGFWDSTTFLYCAPNGGATPKNFTVDPATDTVYSTSHGYSDTQTIVFYNGTAPGGLTEGTVYYVRDSATHSFKVAATSGGAAIDITSAAGWQCSVCAITLDVYAVQGTHQLSAATISIPD